MAPPAIRKGMSVSARSNSTRVTRLPGGSVIPYLLRADGIEVPDPAAVHGGVRVVQDMDGETSLGLPRECLDDTLALRWSPVDWRPATQRMEFCRSRASRYGRTATWSARCRREVDQPALPLFPHQRNRGSVGVGLQRVGQLGPGTPAGGSGGHLASPRAASFCDGVEFCEWTAGITAMTI